MLVIPWHVTGFYQPYELNDIYPTSAETLRKAVEQEEKPDWNMFIGAILTREKMCIACSVENF